MAEDNNYGAAKTDIRDLLNYGGLNLSQEQLNQAKEFVKSFQPQPEPVDKNLAMLLYFSKMAEEASKPGATLLGSAATALQSPTAYLLQKREEQRRAGQPAVGDVLQVAELMAKPKSVTDKDPKNYVSKIDLYLDSAGNYTAVTPHGVTKPTVKAGDRFALNSRQFAALPKGLLGKISGYEKESDAKTIPLYLKEEITFEGVKYGTFNPAVPVEIVQKLRDAGALITDKPPEAKFGENFTIGTDYWEKEDGTFTTEKIGETGPDIPKGTTIDLTPKALKELKQSGVTIISKSLTPKAPVWAPSKKTDKVNEKGQPIFLWEQYQSGVKTGETLESATKPGGSAGTNISIGGNKEQEAFGKTTGTEAANRFAKQLEVSLTAGESIRTLDNLINILDNPDVETNVWRNFLLPMQNFAIGFFGRKAANEYFDPSTVDSLQVFRAEASKLVLAAVSQMKGALSDKELGFLESQQANLSSTKEGNQFLLLSQKALMEKASAFSDWAYNWQQENGMLKNALEYQGMIREWRKSEIYNKTLKQSILEDMQRYEEALKAQGMKDEKALAEALAIRYPTKMIKNMFQSAAYNDVYLKKPK